MSTFALHSQALLAAGILSPSFVVATVAVPRALSLIMSKSYYSEEPAGSAERNFLIDLIRSEQQTPDNSKLDHFAADLNKLGTNIAGLNQAAQKALIAQGIEWYYWQGASANTTYTGQEFFTQSGTLLQYTTAQGAELQGAQNKALPYVKAWLDSALGSVQNGTLLVATPDYTRFAQWNVNTGATGVSAAALDPAKTQIFIGQGGADSFAGGNAADLLFGGAGDDTLIGNTGNDTLLGGSGVDTYQFSAAWGKDLIADSDGLAVVRDAARETFSARHPRPITSNSIAARGHRVGIEGLSGTKFRAFGARRRCWRWRLGRGELNTLLARPRRCPPHIGLRRHLTCVRGAGWPLESLACDLHGFRLTHDLCATPTLSAERDET